MYKITSEIEAKLGTVTNRALKILDSLGLLNTGNFLTKEEMDIILDALQTLDRGKAAKGIEILLRRPQVNELEIYINNEKLYNLITAVFELNNEQKDSIISAIEKGEVNMEEVLQGVYNFFSKLNPNLGRLITFTENLVNS